MGAEYTDEQLMSMPLDQLEQLVLGRAQALGQAQNAQPTMSGAAPDQGMQSMMADQMIDGATVLAATTQLAQMGVPIQPTEQLTPEIIQALQAALGARGLRSDAYTQRTEMVDAGRDRTAGVEIRIAGETP